jgi:hypothetical protein
MKEPDDSALEGVLASQSPFGHEERLLAYMVATHDISPRQGGTTVPQERMRESTVSGVAQGAVARHQIAADRSLQVRQLVALQQLMNASPRVSQLAVLQRLVTSPPVQRAKVEQTVQRPSQAVLMDSEGSIFGGTVVRELTLGTYILIDSADVRRSSREMTGPEGALWYRAQIIGVTDVAGDRIYVPASALEAVGPETADDAREARQIYARYRPEVEEQIREMMETMGLSERPPHETTSVRGALAYFLWLAKIGDNLGRHFPDLQELISQRIEQSRKGASEDQANELTEEGMIFEGMLIKPVNDRLKTWAAVITAKTNEVIESLIDMATTVTSSPKLADLLNDVPQRKIDLLQTFAGYLQLGRIGIEKALSSGLNEELASALASVDGCYAWQVQQIERIQKAPSSTPIDPAYNPWHLKPSEIGFYSFTFDGQLIDELVGVNGEVAEVEFDNDGTAKLRVGAALKSAYVNPGYIYKIQSISDEVIVLVVDRG